MLPHHCSVNFVHDFVITCWTATRLLPATPGCRNCTVATGLARSNVTVQVSSCKAPLIVCMYYFGLVVVVLLPCVPWRYLLIPGLCLSRLTLHLRNQSFLSMLIICHNGACVLHVLEAMIPAAVVAVRARLAQAACTAVVESPMLQTLGDDTVIILMKRMLTRGSPAAFLHMQLSVARPTPGCLLTWF